MSARIPGTPDPEVVELRRRLEEAEQTLQAIRTGAVDALLVQDEGGPRVYTLDGADRPYRLLVEQMQQGAATLLEDGTIAYGNRRLAELLAVPHSRLAGARLPEFFLSDGNQLSGLVDGARAGVAQTETHLVRSDGVQVPVLLTLNSLPPDSGAALGLLVTDLTAQRLHERLAAAHDALRESERISKGRSDQLSAFLETAAVWLHRVGPTGTILWANDAELQALGYSRAEYVGRNIAEFHVDALEIDDIMDRLRRGERIRERESRMRCRDGSIRTVVLDSSVLWDESRFVHTQCFTRDITERKRAEDSLRVYQEKLERMVEERTAALTASHERLRAADRLAAVGTMAAGLAHDMSNALMPLTARVEDLLANPRFSPEVKREVTPIVALLDHLRDLARNLSLFARDPEQEGSAGRTDLADWRRRVSGLLESSVQDAPGRDGKSRGHPVRVKWEFPDDLPAVAVAPHRLTQAVHNLVVNARNAIVASGKSESGDGSGRVTIRAERSDPGTVTVQIVDDGIGMDDAMVRHSTEPFYSGSDAPASNEASGIGLGLALVHTIVQRAGGRIRIDSQRGVGTTVTLILRSA